MKLTDIPVVFICPDHNEKYSQRKEHTFTLLHKLGFNDVTMFKSGTESYPKCLVKATRDILCERLNDEPFILIEDDVELSEWADLDMDFDMPADTDAFYLGLSRYAASHIENHSNGWNSYEVKDVSDKHVRILNMLSTHAIMYVSKKYKEAVIGQMEFALNTTDLHFNDVLITHIQPNFNVYAYRYAFFYQSDKFGNPWHVKDATNFRF